MNDQILEIRLSPKGIKPVKNGHPWVFRNALAGRPRPAAVPVDIARTVTGSGLSWKSTRPAIACDPTGTPLGWGIYNENSRLALRMITRNPSSVIYKGLLVDLIRRAVTRRSGCVNPDDTDAYRLVFGEADGFPGLVVDRLGDTLALEISGAFAWENRTWIREELLKLVPCKDVLVLPDEEHLALEGITDLSSEEDADYGRGRSPGPVIVRENGLSWHADPRGGQKTGYYCDQRVNRRRAGELVAAGADQTVLDAFCYHGGFGLTALDRGARRVVFADSSAAALEMVETNYTLQQSEREAKLHGVDIRRDVEMIKGDLFTLLRRDELVSGGLVQFDLVVLDPPKLAPARRHKDAGLRAYKDLNLSVMRFMRPGARLMTFSCSGVVSREEFRTALAWAAADAGRTVRIEEILSQGPDHPVPLHFPDAEYLKGFLLRLD